MKFLRKNINENRYLDSIFPVVNAAKADNDENKINATAGCLYDEDGKLFVYKTVFDSEMKLDVSKKAGYAASPMGNDNYVRAISKYVLEDRVSNNHGTIATVGGTGALYTALKLCLTDKDTVIYPEISWGNYKTITQDANLNGVTYNVYDLDDLLNKIDQTVGKTFVIINSPCENPLGHSYTDEQWKIIFDKANNANKEIVILVDNAYMDYAYNDAKNFFELFNHINDNVLVLIAVSCSKSFSYYGYRLGALIAINNDAQFVDSFLNYASRLARTTWSNASNGAMNNVAEILENHFDEFVKERDESKQLLKKRTDLFIAQAKENNLEIYPYTEGFFVTLKIEDLALRDQIHQRLLDNHIYTIRINKGIRVGICSVPLKKVDGLAKRIKDLY